MESPGDASFHAFARMVSNKTGWLKVVGTGTRLGQITAEVQSVIEEADVIFTLVSDGAAFEAIQSINPHVFDLGESYVAGRDLLETYHSMAERVLLPLRLGNRVCFAIYGHPAVLATPGRLAIKMARREGYEVAFLPGVSSLDSAFCDLDLDPAIHGCQIYEASLFVGEDRIFDPRSVLALLQASIVGQSHLIDEPITEAMIRLCDKLESAYGPDHPVIQYVAAIHGDAQMEAVAVSIAELRSSEIKPRCTLFVPPIDDPDLFDAYVTAKGPTKRTDRWMIG